ncbi:unnamed protein product [Rotaria magnacalcarata]|nr:unnamed protein product [Rotaria magnacalcarata]CAF3789591.1 unnamed protein product [Rotaria magnacalcarata]
MNPKYTNEWVTLPSQIMEKKCGLAFSSQELLDIIIVLSSLILLCLLAGIWVTCSMSRGEDAKQHNQTSRHDNKDMKALANVLDEITDASMYNNSSTSSLFDLFDTIDHIYTRVNSSSYYQSLFIKKLIDKKFAGLCVTILNLNSDELMHCHNKWQAFTCALHGLNSYMDVSQELCQDALQAGIIHSLAPLLLQTSYLEILETNNSILSLFQTITRIFLHIAEIDELKHYLENYDCCKVCINDRIVAQIGNDKIIKYPFNIHDSSILFRLYYDASTSKDKTAHGIDQSELLNGFLALGQLETKYYNGANN